MSGPGVGELLASNESLQDAPAVWLFAAKNLAAYVTLMERHLDGSAKTNEAEFVSRIEQDLAEVGLPVRLAWGWSKGGPVRTKGANSSSNRNICRTRR
jgi:hypothetical protein